MQVQWSSLTNAPPLQVKKRRNRATQFRVAVGMLVIAVLLAAGAFAGDAGTTTTADRSAEVLHSARLQHLTASIT